MIYLDTSALVKLLFDEAESSALESWLEEHATLSKITSELTTIELHRVCRRVRQDTTVSATRLLAGLDLIPMVGVVVERAANVGPPSLRTLDAVHLSSAVMVRAGLVALVTYDVRLARAAEDEHIAVVAPG